MMTTSKEDKRELRKKAEEEKVCLLPSVLGSLIANVPYHQSKLKHMNSMTYAFFSGSSPSCAVIPTKFYRSWKRWVDSPTTQPRPEAADNSPFLCDSHSTLLFDPNFPEEIENKMTIIRRDEYDELVSL